VQNARHCSSPLASTVSGALTTSRPHVEDVVGVDDGQPDDPGSEKAGDMGQASVGSEGAEVGAPAEGSVGADELPGEADTVVVAFGARGKVDVVSRRLLLRGLDHRVDLGTAGAAPVRVGVDRVLGEHAFHERATLLRFAFVPGRDVVTDDRRGVDHGLPRVGSGTKNFPARSRGGNDLVGNGASCRRLPGLGREPQPRARNAVAQDDELNSGIVLRLLEGFELSAPIASGRRPVPAPVYDQLDSMTRWVTDGGELRCDGAA